MPMMRRGPLAKYSAEWVLGQASANDASGSIEFHTTQPLTLYVDGGRVSHGVEGVQASGFTTDPTAEAHGNEETARTRVVRLVAQAMRATDGWYYLDPIGHHDIASPWRWEALALVRDACGRGAGPSAAPAGPTPDPAPTAAPADEARAASVPREIRLDAAPADEAVTLTAETWSLVCALARPMATEDLRRTLDWSAARLDASLSELSRAGVLADGPEPAEHPAAGEAVPSSPAAPPVSPVSPVPPTVPQLPVARPAAVASADRRGALRRLISNLRPA